MHDNTEIEQKVLALIISEPNLYYEYNDRLYVDLFDDLLNLFFLILTLGKN